MEPVDLAERTRQHTMFLLDGLLRMPSPVLLVVDEESTAAQVAIAVHDGSAQWDDRPAQVGKLWGLDAARISAGHVGEFDEIFVELASTDVWLFISNIDALVETSAGQRFLNELADSIGGGELTAVIASTAPELLPRVHSQAPRLMGFAAAVQREVDSDYFGHTSIRSIVLQSTNPTDVGWVVAVRYELTGPIREDPGTLKVATDDQLQLVDSMSLAVDDGKPLGLIVSLTPHAFSVSQEESAFALAALAAERVVGRRLDPEEHIVAARGLFYA